MKIKKILIFKLLALLSISFLLASCGPVYQTSYTYVPPKAYKARMCVNRCLRGKSRCQARCSEQAQWCHRDADQAASPAYRTYVREQRRLHQPVYKTINDFADYSNCNSNCGCEPTYRQCYTNCGGKIIPHTRCVAFCKTAEPAVTPAPAPGAKS